MRNFYDQRKQTRSIKTKRSKVLYWRVLLNGSQTWTLRKEDIKRQETSKCGYRGNVKELTGRKKCQIK